MDHDLPPDDRDPPNALPRGTLLHDKFRLQRVIGVGGFGIVYLAHDEMSDVDVAIKEYMPSSLAGRSKTMHVSLSSQSNAETFALGLKSFWNEARLLARFRDEPLPLLKVYDAFKANGTAYMVMPVLRGRTAYQLRRDMAEPPNERWLRRLLTELLPAVERLHAENVYHRDIAPDNIQIDALGRPVLMDLGAARHVISNRTQSITAILKPGYAPIEQYGENEQLRQGPWTDIYALGATLHYLLLCNAPASATARIFHAGKALAAQDLPGCSPAFLRVIDWMLAPKPEDRPQSVAQLRNALDDSLATTRVMAPNPSPPVAAAASARVVAPKPLLPATPATPPVAANAGALLMSATTLIPVNQEPAPAAPRPQPPSGPAEVRPLVAEAAASFESASESAPAPAAAPAPAPEPSPATPSAFAASSAAATPATAYLAPTAPARSRRPPLPMVLAGVAALGLVVGAAAWLWPRSTAPSAAVAGPRAASRADVAKAVPVAEPRPEATNPPVTAFTAAPESTPAAAAAPLPVPPPAAAQATQATAKPPTAVATAPVETAPTQAAAMAPGKRASAPTVTSVPGKRGAPLNDKDGALLPKPAEPAPPAPVVVAPAPAPPPPSPVAPPAAAPVTPAPAPAAPTVASPSERCSDQDGFARSLCVGMVCGKRELHDHPECVAIRRR